MKSRLVFALVAGLLVAACSSPPAEKTETVREAVDRAARVEADVYAPEAWTRANDAWTAAEAELARQGARLSLFRSYGDANSLLDIALAGAEKAYEGAVERRRQMTTEVDVKLGDIRGDLDLADELLSKLVGCRTLRGSEALEALADALWSFRGAYDDIETDLAEDNVFDAWAASRTLSEETERLLDEVDGLAEKSGCKA